MRFVHYALVAMALAGLLLMGSCCGSDDDTYVPGAEQTT
jgi:hypothetical protein